MRCYCVSVLWIIVMLFKMVVLVFGVLRCFIFRIGIKSFFLVGSCLLELYKYYMLNELIFKFLKFSKYLWSIYIMTNVFSVCNYGWSVKLRSGLVLRLFLGGFIVLGVFVNFFAFLFFICEIGRLEWRIFGIVWGFNSL